MENTAQKEDTKSAATEQGKAIATLTAQVNAQSEEIAALREELEQERIARQRLTQTVASGSATISLTPDRPVPSALVVTVGKKKLRFKALRFITPEGTVNAADVAEDKERLAQLVRDYPGLFEEVEE